MGLDYTDQYTQAFGVLVCSFNLKVAKALGLMMAPEALYQANRLIR
jgi:hypothetical protein